MPNNELYHHGILGMKWGVRRYQNADGTLTPAGRKRYYDVGTSERKKKRDTKDALKILDRSIATDSAIIDRANRRQAKMEKKAADSIIKFQDNANKTNPNPAHAKQHQAKANKYFIKAIEYAEQGQKIVERKENSQRLYNSITSGEKKAGKDFIVQRDYNFYPMLLPVPDVGLLVGGAFNREMRIIER